MATSSVPACLAGGSSRRKPRSVAPMRSMPGCGTVQAPPWAAVPPARGGIGPGERPAWADPG
jgi:hypothetical protein